MSEQIIETRVMDLQLGDVVILGPGPYMTGTVYRIDPNSVMVFRPYVQTADFTYTGGVITYIGHEDVSLHRDNRTVTLVSRRDPEETRNKLKAIKEEISAALELGHIWKAKDLLRNF